MKRRTIHQLTKQLVPFAISGIVEVTYYDEKKTVRLWHTITRKSIVITFAYYNNLRKEGVLV